jgi:hypothetical protein
MTEMNIYMGFIANNSPKDSLIGFNRFNQSDKRENLNLSIDFEINLNLMKMT